MFKLVLEKAEEPEIKLPTSAGSWKKQEFQKNTYFCFLDYAKAFDCVDHNKLWKILKEMGIPDHLTCLLKNLYTGQEATVRTGHGTTDWFQIGKGVCQGCILSPCLFNLKAEFSSVAQSCPTLCDPWTEAHQASLPITNSRSLSKFMSIESVMPSDHLILCRPLLLLSSIFPSIRVFSNESALRIRWLKYWSFNFNISPSNEHLGLISFRMAWLDLLAVQGTLKSLLQHHSSKSSILWRSAFFVVHLSYRYMTTGKTIAFTRWTFVGKVMSLLFNMLSRLEKEMATHSSVLAWRIPGMAEPGWLPSMGSHKVGHD